MQSGRSFNPVPMQPCSSVNRSRKFAQQSSGGVAAQQAGSSKRQKTADGAPATLRRPLQDLQSNSRPHNQATAQQQPRAQVRAQQQQDVQAWAEQAVASEDTQGNLENAAPPRRPSRLGQSHINSFA
jgi:hypothetical protein